MTAVLRSATAVLLLALLAAACTGADDPAPDTPGGTAAPTGAAAADDPPADDPAADDPAADDPTATTGLDVDAAVLDAAQTWIAEESGLSAMLQEELVLDRVSTTRDVAHLVFAQEHDDVAVRGAQLVVHVRTGATPEVLGASQSLTTTLPAGDAGMELDADAATDIAVDAVPGTVVDVPEVSPTWLESGTDLRLGWDVRVTTDDPPLGFSVVVDATTGDVLDVQQLTSNRHASAASGTDRGQVAAAGAGCDAPPPPSACIFVVDPIYASGDPGIDPTRANRTLVGVPLDNLLHPSSPDLVGRYVQIAPEVAATYADADGVWGEGGRGGDPTFEAGMAYYWIDYAQQVVQEMGFAHHADDPVDVVPIEPAFPDNAFYLFTEDRIHMGAGGDGVNEAEDAQGILHEYGHALLQAAVPDIISEEGGAFHESVGDLVSAFTTIEFRRGDIGCLFHWAERGECIRRLDTDLTYPDDLRFEVHLDGEIFNGAVWDVFEAVLARDGLAPEDCQDRQANPCDEARDQVYGTLLGSFGFLTPQLTLPDAASAFALSDRVFYGGVNAAEIEAAFAAHGLPTDGTVGVQPRPEPLTDLARSPSVVALKIDHPYRGDLAVRLDVLDAAGTSRCGVDLIDPDPQDAGDGIVGRFDLGATSCADLLPPAPDRRWQLTVTDTAPQDEGRVTQFAIGHAGRRFAAAGLPADIPDADPSGLVVEVGG